MTLGETLRQAREAAGFSVQDIQNATHMMSRQIVDMEADDFSSFAQPLYAKGFLRLYARAVGLDPAPLLEQWAALPSSGAGRAEPTPAVALQTIDDDAGGLQIVAPDPPPHSAPPADAGPPHPARPDPVKRVAPPPPEPPHGNAPQPEKRVAAVHPGDPTPEPLSLRAPAPREARPEPDPASLPPVVKRMPEEFEPDDFFDEPPAPPEPLPQTGPLFAFPGSTPDTLPEPAAAVAPEPPAAANPPVAPAAPAAAAPAPEFSPEEPAPVPERPAEPTLFDFAAGSAAAAADAAAPSAVAAPARPSEPAAPPPEPARPAPRPAAETAETPAPEPPEGETADDILEEMTGRRSRRRASVPSPLSKFFPPRLFPSRPVAFAIGGIAALAAVCGLVALFSGGSETPTAEPEPAGTSVSAPAPDAPAAGHGEEAGPELSPVAADEPPPPAVVEIYPVLPPPRLFAN